MKYLYFLIFTLIVSSCSKKRLNAKEYVNWCKENLKSTKEIDKFKFEALSVTADYKLAKDGDEAASNDKQAIYVTFRISNPGGEQAILGSYNTEQFNKNLMYFVDEAAHDFSFITANDTLKPSLYHFERLFNVANFSMIDLIFENPRKLDLKDCRLVYNDRKLNTGKIVLPFPKLESKNMPIFVK